jgi:hypothetical protein
MEMEWKVWNGFIWLKIEFSYHEFKGSCEHGNASFGSFKRL